MAKQNNEEIPEVKVPQTEEAVETIEQPSEDTAAVSLSEDPLVLTRMTDRQMDQVSKDTKRFLDNQSKVTIRLMQNPPDQAQLPAEYVGLNGVTFLIPRGVDVEVPQEIFNILRTAGLV